MGSFSGVLHKTEWWRLDVELSSEVLQVLLPSPLVKDAEDTAGPPAVPQGPGAQSCEQRSQTPE